MSLLVNTTSNHRLESAGLNALGEYLFKMLGMILTNLPRIPTPESIVKYSSWLQRNVYLLKITEAKSFRDESRDIYKDKESNLGPFCWLLRGKLSRSKLYFCFRAGPHALNNYIIPLFMLFVMFFLTFSFLACRGHFFI